MSVCHCLTSRLDLTSDPKTCGCTLRGVVHHAAFSGHCRYITVLPVSKCASTFALLATVQTMTIVKDTDTTFCKGITWRVFQFPLGREPDRAKAYQNSPGLGEVQKQ